MQVVLPSQTRGVEQQFAEVVHVRQLVGVVSQVAHGEVHGVQVDGAVKTYPEEQQSDTLTQVKHSPAPVHEPTAQEEGHSIQVMLASQTRGAEQQFAAVVHVRQLVGVVSQVAQGEVHRMQVEGTVKTYPGEQQLLFAIAQVRHSPAPVQKPATQAEGHSMQVLLPSQTRGGEQQLAKLVHVRQLVGATSQVAH